MTAPDGFTYDRKPIQRWFQIGKTSPSTGQELAIRTLKRDDQRALSIKNWVAVDTIHQPPPPELKRTRYASSVDSSILVRFLGARDPNISFTRRVSKALSVADLYNFAYQGMKGRHAEFELRCGDALLSPLATTIDDRGLEDGSKLYIHIEVNGQNASTSAKGGRDSRDKPLQELSLVKVYRDRDTPLFSYWLPRNSVASFVSVILRYWRYNAEEGLNLTDGDIDTWTEMRYNGDGVTVGIVNRHWEKLKLSTKRTYGAGTLGNEKLHHMDGDPEPDSRSCRYERNVQVLKVQVIPYSSLSNMRRNLEKAQKKMTRVCLFQAKADCH